MSYLTARIAEPLDPKVCGVYQLNRISESRGGFALDYERRFHGVLG